METTNGYSDSSCDKEQDSTQFLLVKLTTAKLWPLLKPCKVSSETCFYTKVYKTFWDCSSDQFIQNGEIEL